MIKQASRGTEIDTEKCVENAGGRFDLVIMAAARSREIRRQNQWLREQEQKKELAKASTGG